MSRVHAWGWSRTRASARDTSKRNMGLLVTWVQLALRLRISKAQPVVLPWQDPQGCRSVPLPRGSSLCKPVEENYVLFCFFKKGFSRKKFGSVELDIFIFQVCATPSGMGNSQAGALLGSEDTLTRTGSQNHSLGEGTSKGHLVQCQIQEGERRFRN